MSYVSYNPNPDSKDVGDCVIRALSVVTSKDWEQVYIELCALGFEMRDMPSANRVWSEYLKQHGFSRYAIPNSCPSCYTIKDFCNDYQQGIYVVATGSHVVGVVSGSYFDSWDSGDEVPVYYFSKEEN